MWVRCVRDIPDRNAPDWDAGKRSQIVGTGLFFIPVIYVILAPGIVRVNSFGGRQ